MFRNKHWMEIFLTLYFVLCLILALVDQARAAVGLSLSPEHKCKIQHGKEANLADEGCETYWECRDYKGVALLQCPDGGQFDFHMNECRHNGLVWCQWQHYQLEKPKDNKIPVMPASRDDVEEEESDDNNSNDYDDNYDDGPNYSDNDKSDYDDEGEDDEYDDEEGNGNDEVYYDEEEKEKQHSHPHTHKGRTHTHGHTHHIRNHHPHVMHTDNVQTVIPQAQNHFQDVDKWTYVCSTEYGHEPNMNDKTCQSFWSCDRYKGSLIRCQMGHLYDYRAKACRRQRAVRCRRQHNHHMTTEPKHKVEVRKKNDGSITLIHHYFYDQ